MFKVICIFLIFFVKAIFAEQTLCDCYTESASTCEIEYLIAEYKEAARKNFLNKLPPYREKWEIKFREDFKHVESLERDSFAILMFITIFCYLIERLAS